MVARHPNAAYLSALILLSVALWLPRLQGPLDFRYDAGVYYILGTSLAGGKGYRLLNEPGEIQAIQYPPLLPLVAAAYQRAAGTSDPSVAGHWLRLTFFLLFVGYIAAAYLMSRYYLAPGLAFLAALVTLLHVQTHWMSELLFAEIPFVLTTIVLVLTMQRSERKPCGWVAGLLAVAAYLLRTIGIAVLAAWVGDSLLKGKWRQTICRIIVAIIPVLGWQGYIASVKSTAEYARPAYPYQRADYQYYNVGYLDNIRYVDGFAPELGRISAGALVRRIGSNLLTMPASWGEAVSSRAVSSVKALKKINERSRMLRVPLWIVYVPLMLFATLIFSGLLLLAFRGEWLIPLYVAGSVAVMSLTPWPGQFERYLSPLTPFFALSLFYALAAIRQHLSLAARVWWRSIGIALTVVIPAGMLAQEAFVLFRVYTGFHPTVMYEDERGKTREYRLFFYSQTWRLHDTALDWLKREAKPGEVVATSTPHWAYLKTGLRAVLPPFDANVREAQRLLDSVPVSYLIVDNIEAVDITRRYAAPVVRAFPERWALIYSTPGDGSQIYRRVTPGGSTGPP